MSPLYNLKKNMLVYKRLKIKLTRHIWQKDGLVNLEYQSILKRRKGLYVWVYVNINMDKYRQVKVSNVEIVTISK
jgi:hypothetical protein